MKKSVRTSLSHYIEDEIKTPEMAIIYLSLASKSKDPEYMKVALESVLRALGGRIKLSMKDRTRIHSIISKEELTQEDLLIYFQLLKLNKFVDLSKL
jgi:hypothetical protein